MSFFTALLDATGARNQAKAQAQQTAYQNALAQEDMALRQRQEAFDERNAGMQNQLLAAQLAQYQRDLAQQAANRQFESGLQLPKGWGKMQPDQRIAYLTQRYNAAQRAGDTDIAKNTLDEINSLELGAERLANAQYTTQGRLPLAQAQAGWWRQRHSEVMAALQEKERVADAQMRGAMQRAYISASTRLQAAQMSNEERSYIAAQTALNVANRQNEAQAFQSAMAQYRTAAAAWQNQEKNYQLGIGSDPGAAPTPQQFTVNMPAPSAPSITVVPITLPNGRTVTAPTVNPHPTNSAADIEYQKYYGIAARALASGTPAAKVVQMMNEAVQAGKMPTTVRDRIQQELFGSR